MKKNTIIKITLIFAFLMVNTSFLIKSGVAKYLYGPTMVYAGQNVNLSWYVDPVDYSDGALSIVSSSYEGEDWVIEINKDDLGWNYFSKPLIKLGEWDFQVTIYKYIKIWGIIFPIPFLSEVETIEGVDCVFPNDIRVDVKIMYDTAAANYLSSEWNEEPESLARCVDDALDIPYYGYWGEDIDFFTGTDSNWLIYDINGDMAITWFQDKSLPVGQGHGYDFDICIYFTYDENLDAYGVTQDDFIRINLANHDWFEEWSRTPFLGTPKYGVYSTIMHESGHVFRITGAGRSTDIDGDDPSTGDTYKQRKSVMDYYYGVHGYGEFFDQGHRDTIAWNIANRIS
ncbi:MAG: hypothetical protein KGD63_13060 [Candidatus Lokiarchaeota archaeon]|nr:hypothetical protein [Candidatus Lokiarchaeota archaeon]